MVDFVERGRGAEKGLPTLIQAASSVDDVFVIILFSILLGMYPGGQGNWLVALGSIPVSVILGLAAGLTAGYLLARLFRRVEFKSPGRSVMVIGAAIALVFLEEALRGVVPFAGLLGVMAIGFHHPGKIRGHRPPDIHEASESLGLRRTVAVRAGRRPGQRASGLGIPVAPPWC